MYVTETEFIAGVDKYLEIALSEDIYIVINGVPSIVVFSSERAIRKISDSMTDSDPKKDQDSPAV